MEEQAKQVNLLKINFEGEVVETFSTIADAAASVGKQNGAANILICAGKNSLECKNGTAYGFIWRYSL